MREACGDAHLKAILAHRRPEDAAQRLSSASMVAMQAGADFIKTSTGKEDVNATLPVSLVMVRAIRDYLRADRREGRLQAGRRHEDRQGRADLADPDEGGAGPAAGCEPELFRIGASSMLGRHRAPDRALRDRPLFGRATATRWPEETSHGPAVKEILDTMDYGPAPEAQRPRRSPGSRATKAASAISSTASSSRPPTASTSPSSIRRAASRSPSARRAPPRTSTRPSRPRASAFKSWSKLSGHERARHLYAIARHHPEARALLRRCWRRWTTASRSARAATSTSRWSPATSTTTPAGPS